jgi:Zn-dependent protease
MRQYLALGRWWGVPVRAHWSVLFAIPWYYLHSGSFRLSVIAFVPFGFLMVVHEFGHAAVARWQQLRVEQINLYFLHGQCIHETPHYEAEDVRIAWGGVGAQFILFVIALAATVPVRYAPPVAQFHLEPFFWVLLQGNLLLIAFNLIPIAPLDGHIAWRFVPGYLARLRPRARALFQKKPGPVKKTNPAQAEKIAADAIKKMMGKENA